MNALMLDGDTTVLDFRYIGRFIEGEDFWSGSLDAASGTTYVPPSISNVCARISTGDAAEDPTICDSLGISVAGIPFVDRTTPADVAVQNDFPATPTF